MTLPVTVKRLFATLIFLIGMIFSVAVSMFVAYHAATFTPRVGLLVTFALLVFALVIVPATGLASKITGAFLSRFTLVTSATLTVLFSLALYLAFLRPTSFAHVDPLLRANTQYWNLATGSHIAYSLYEPPVGIPVRQDPIMFVHGGAGLRAFDSDHEFYRRFTQDGFRVYLFDQAGSGLSGLLPHAAEYTVERYVADLEGMRQQIGADRLILIGHSWGGALIAHYAAAYPDHVAKLVFHSPGPLWDINSAPFEYQRTDARRERPLPPVRVLAAIILSHASWNAAENLLPQQASGDWEQATMDPGEVVCKGAGTKQAAVAAGTELAGLNLYPLLVTNRELNDKPQMKIREQLGRLHIPAIMLTSQCDFVPWSQQVKYKQFIPGLQQFYFPDAGHYINVSQPAPLAAAIRSFLLAQPPPFPAYQGDKSPRPPISNGGKLFGK